MDGKRTPGRPGGGDSRDLRPSIIDAAVQCYAQQGVAATALKDIADTAGVTPALLHYYFGSRLQLQHAVLEERVRPLVQEVQREIGAGRAPASPLLLAYRFVAVMAGIVERYPWWPPLWTREVLLPGGVFRESLVAEFGQRFFREIIASLSAAQQRGDLPADIEPRMLIVSLIGLTLFPAAAEPVWRPLLDAADIDDQTMQRHTRALLTSGIGGTA